MYIMYIMKTIQQQKQTYKKKTMEQEQNERMDRGVQIYLNKQVMKVDGLDEVYIVKSCQDQTKFYTVENDQCDCMDFQRRQVMCKHIFAVIYHKNN